MSTGSTNIPQLPYQTETRIPLDADHSYMPQSPISLSLVPPSDDFVARGQNLWCPAQRLLKDCRAEDLSIFAEGLKKTYVPELRGRMGRGLCRDCNFLSRRELWPGLQS